jgi:hypothetical protein
MRSRLAADVTATPPPPEVSTDILLAGLAMLVPLPLLDEYCHQHCVRSALKKLPVGLDDAAMKTLTEDRTPLWRGCLYLVLVWPLKKIFRTVLYFLTLKDVVDATARAALRVRMVELAWSGLPGEAEVVRQHMDAVLARHQVSPVMRFLFRHDRPPLHGDPPVDLQARIVHHAMRHAGGAVVIPAFQARLEDSCSAGS